MCPWRHSVLPLVLWHWPMAIMQRPQTPCCKWTPTWFPCNAIAAWRGSQATSVLVNETASWHRAVLPPADTHTAKWLACSLAWVWPTPISSCPQIALAWFGTNTEQLLWAWTSCAGARGSEWGNQLYGYKLHHTAYCTYSGQRTVPSLFYLETPSEKYEASFWHAALHH